MGCWAFPSKQEELEEFKSLMSEEVFLTEKNKSRIYHCVGDDCLFDSLDEIECEEENPYEIDVRQIILARVVEMLEGGYETFVRMERNVYDELLKITEDPERLLYQDQARIIF